MTGYVGELKRGQTLSAEQYFQGPWREFSRETIDTGSEHTFEAKDCEYAIFVMSGFGEATVGSITHPLTPGSALTVGYRAKVTITPSTDPIELFITTLNV
jgi:hypothetical protein